MILMQVQMTIYLLIALVVMASLAIGLFLRGVNNRAKIIWSGVILLLVWLISFDLMFIWRIWRG